MGVLNWLKRVESKIGAFVALKFATRSGWVSWLSRLVSLLAVYVLACWILKHKLVVLGIEFEQEPVLVALTMIAAGLNQVHVWLLKESEYSPAYALALGYVKNFLSPVLTQLIEQGEHQPLIYVYKPSKFTELFKNNIDRVKAEIRNQEFDLSEVNLALKHGRARDILTIQKSKKKKVYFDFPNTLTSLIAYVEYKIPSETNSSSEMEKAKLSEKLILKFFEKVNLILEQEGYADNVRFCDNELNFKFK
jgi:hypothetical protein